MGISSIDGLDASENSTGSQYKFENQRWYRIRVEVKKERLQAWIDDRQVVDAYTEDQRLSLREGPIEECAPFGLATKSRCVEGSHEKPQALRYSPILRISRRFKLSPINSSD